MSAARRWRVRAGAFGAACAATGLLAACGSTPATSQVANSAPAATSSLATSLATSDDSWALVPMSTDPTFWQVFARPTASAAWQLVTPPGVADNGGLVAAGTGGSLTVAFRPSQSLTFSPLAVSSDGGGQWSTGLIAASVAPAPGALAASGGRMLALLTNGTVLDSSNAGSTWRTLAGKGTVADSSAGRKCGVLGVTDVSFGINGTDMLAAGTCGAAGTGVFAYSAGGWRQVTLPVTGRVVRMMPGIALVVSGARLSAAWETASRWQVSAPLDASGVEASGSLAPDGAWVLLPGRHAATIGGPGQPWRTLPLVPQGTSVLAGGPGGAVDALAVTGSRLTDLTVWRLAPGATAWSKIQTINVPIQTGSSS